jgi:hypothetical protein
VLAIAAPPALESPPDAFCLPPPAFPPSWWSPDFPPPEPPPLALPDDGEDVCDPPPEVPPPELSPPELPPPDFPPPEPPPELAEPPPQATSEAQAAPTPSAVPSRINLSRDTFSKTSSSCCRQGSSCYTQRIRVWIFQRFSTPASQACQHATPFGLRLSVWQLDPIFTLARM